MSFPQSNILLVESVHSVNHLLHQLHFTISQPVLIGDVIGDSSLSTRFTTSSTRLKVKLLASGSEDLGTKLGPTWEVNVNRGSHASSKISWASMDVTIPFIQHEIVTRFLLD